MNNNTKLSFKFRDYPLEWIYAMLVVSTMVVLSVQETYHFFKSWIHKRWKSNSLTKEDKQWLKQSAGFSSILEDIKY